MKSASFAKMDGHSVMPGWFRQSCNSIELLVHGLSVSVVGTEIIIDDNNFMCRNLVTLNVGQKPAANKRKL